MHLNNSVFPNKWARLFPDISIPLSRIDSQYNLPNSTVYPAKKDIFKAFRLCDFDNLKIVILGQDPYFNPEYATGLAFANPVDTLKLAPSLELIRERIRLDFYNENPADFVFDCTLESWAKQGILLLNSSLTVRQGYPGSHVSIWRPVLEEFITNLGQVTTGLVYILLGNQARYFKSFINLDANYVLEYNHPAYYARLNQSFKCDGFLKAYEIVINNYNETIKF